VLETLEDARAVGHDDEAVDAEVQLHEHRRAPRVLVRVEVLHGESDRVRQVLHELQHARLDRTVRPRPSQIQSQPWSIRIECNDAKIESDRNRDKKMNLNGGGAASDALELDLKLGLLRLPAILRAEHRLEAGADREHLAVDARDVAERRERRLRRDARERLVPPRAHRVQAHPVAGRCSVRARGCGVSL
jgi:hypothetical protein